MTEDVAQAAEQPTDGPPVEDPQPLVYAIGKVEPQVPSVAIQKELDQAISQIDTSGQTDREAVCSALESRHNRYLARQLCFTFNVGNVPTYLLVARDPADVELFVEATRPRPQASDLDIIIGQRGPVTPPQVCNGIGLPMVITDQIYSFDRESLVQSIPRPETISANDEDQFRASAAELFDRMLQSTDNSGAQDEHRAINYLAMRYPAIYATAADAHGRNLSLSAIEAHRSRLSGARNIMDVVFTYTNRNTDVSEKYFVRVDVTEKFPFLVSKIAPYYERP